MSPLIAPPSCSPHPALFSGQTLSWGAIRRLLAEPLDLSRPIDLHLMRHGETDTNARGLVTGAIDAPLTGLGREQAAMAGRQLDRRYDAAFHSALSRTQETLAIAARAGQIELGLVCMDWRLNERSLGELESKPARHIEEFARGDLSYAPLGGESYAEVARRILSFLLDLLRFVSASESFSLLLCGHMGPMRILMGIFDEQDDPSQVLSRRFQNSQVLRARLRRLVLPRFLTSVAVDPC